MRELLRYIIALFLIGGTVWAATLAIKTLEEDKKPERGLLWMADTNKKYTEFEPGLVAFLKDTPTHKVLCAGKTFPEMEEEVKEWVADEIYQVLKQSKQ